jgi:GTP cyclohydrolase I
MAFDRKKILKSTEILLEGLGIESNTKELTLTPSRVADYWMERLAGYEMEPAVELKGLPGLLQPCPIILENIPFVSTCEHHLAPFSGIATIGYIPGTGGTVGLSKLVRLLHGFANRLQVQERMTNQIAEALAFCLYPKAWGVRLIATHTCMAHRGVKTLNVPVTTTITGGDWIDRPPIAFQ